MSHVAKDAGSAHMSYTRSDLLRLTDCPECDGEGSLTTIVERPSGGRQAFGEDCKACDGTGNTERVDTEGVA